MILKNFDLNKLTKLLTLQVDQVTCLECCKYYIAPETAPCSHTLCHTCWRKRRICPICSGHIDRGAIKLNWPLQNFTEHVHMLVDAYEKLFKIKLDEFMLDRSGAIESENDPTKNVKDWLASSENQFSAPVIHSEELSQDVMKTINVELSSSKVQIHSNTVKMNSPKKVVHKPVPQDDWDKIETVPECEVLKNKENVVGPMDIEPYDLDDDEYTVKNPRRSSRKKESKNNHTNDKMQDFSADKHSCKDSVGETDKKSNKSKQDWSNVKKMRKEFSKLNKKNKNKLNVSIEMCKKTQLSNNKPNVVNPVAITQHMYEIDDNTPSLVYTEEKNVCIDSDKNNHMTPALKSKQLTVKSCLEILDKPINPKHILENNNRITDNIKATSDENIQVPAMLQKQNMEDISLSSTAKSDKHPNNNLGDQNIPNKMLFFKKSALCPIQNINEKNINTDKNNIETVNHYIDSKSITEDNDDIEISIKIGNTLTNIFIKKKMSDVQLKVNTDREIQTSLGPHQLFSNNNLPEKGNPVHNIEINLETDDNKITHVQEVPKKPNDKTIYSVKEKSISTKKNTASADTVTVPFETTKSMEKELSNIMECEEDVIEQSLSKDVKQTSQVIQSKYNDIYAGDVEDAELLNGIDIFESDSVKESESNIKFLKATKNTPSEILISTVHTKSRTQKTNVDKREREMNDDDEMQINKRMKIDSDKNPKQMLNDNNDTSVLNQNENAESEPLNYDVIMDQVFANIDADIEDIKKSQNTIKNTYNIKHIETELSDAEKQIPHEEIISQTQKSKTVGVLSSVKIDCTLNVKEFYDHKESENVFSFLDKDHTNCEAAKRNDEAPASVQELVDDMLTPVMCRNLESSRDCSLQAMDKNYDSDKSIVEETPQKNHSFSKKQKNINTSSKEVDRQTAKNMAPETMSAQEKISIDTTNRKSIINLTDTESISNKDLTVINTVATKQIMDTPLTINKFVNQIKHKSTPVARKSLNFDDENGDDDPEQTLCPTTEPVAKNTQEKEFLTKAFEKTPSTAVIKPMAMKNITIVENKKLCIAGSCLTAGELTKVRQLCSERKWTYVDKYTKEVTHLVVGVDEENKSQRSVKYMCALAAGKWIVSYEWVERCLHTKKCVNEAAFEALDGSGAAGPRRARTAHQKLFHGITFFCMPPFSVLDEDALKGMLEASGGRVVSEAKQVRVTEHTPGPALLLAEPENTQEDRFIYLAMELSIVPVNFEWVLNCLGSYTLGSIHELLLCPSSLLPAATARWPQALIAPENDD